jgi:hypothetical protein
MTDVVEQLIGLYECLSTTLQTPPVPEALEGTGKWVNWLDVGCWMLDAG